MEQINPAQSVALETRSISELPPGDDARGVMLPVCTAVLDSVAVADNDGSFFDC